MKILIRTTLVIGLWLQLSPLLAGPGDKDLLQMDPEISVGKLDNGMTYYIRRNGKPGVELHRRADAHDSPTVEHPSCNGEYGPIVDLNKSPFVRRLRVKVRCNFDAPHRRDALHDERLLSFGYHCEVGGTGRASAQPTARFMPLTLARTLPRTPDEENRVGECRSGEGDGHRDA